MVFVGYTAPRTAYQVLVSSEIVETGSVHFDETAFLFQVDTSQGYMFLAPVQAPSCLLVLAQHIHTPVVHL